MTTIRIGLSGLTCLAVLASPVSAAAGTVEGAAAVSAAATERSQDSAVAAGVDLGYRFSERLGAYARLAAGLGSERERSLQALGAGIRLAYPLGSWRPSARLGFIHQHEIAGEDVAAAELLGYGDRIDHRSGASMGLAITRAIAAHRFGDVYAGLEVGADVFADANPGPRMYYGGTLVFGVTIDR